MCISNTSTKFCTLTLTYNNMCKRNIVLIFFQFVTACLQILSSNNASQNFCIMVHCLRLFYFTKAQSLIIFDKKSYVNSMKLQNKGRHKLNVLNRAPFISYFSYILLATFASLFVYYLLYFLY